MEGVLDRRVPPAIDLDDARPKAGEVFAPVLDPEAQIVNVFRSGETLHHVETIRWLKLLLAIVVSSSSLTCQSGSSSGIRN